MEIQTKIPSSLFSLLSVACRKILTLLLDSHAGLSLHSSIPSIHPLLALLSTLFILSGCQSKSSPKSYLETVRLEVFDDSFYNFITKDTQVEIIAEGHEWTEGPLWVESEQMLLYSDIPNNAIYSWKEGKGRVLWLENAGGAPNRPGSNGLLLDEDGGLILCQHGARQMAKMNSPISSPTADFTTLANNYNGQKLNSPNDAVLASNGDLYFTDPPYGINEQMEKEVDFNGVYKLSKNSGFQLLSDQFTRPNGIDLNPSETQLIVANSDPKEAKWVAFDILEDGSLGNEQLILDVTDRVGEEMPGLPDGLKVTKDGHLFATGPGGLYLFSPTYELLGIVQTGKHTSNCALNTDESTIFLTADDLVLKINLK